MTAPQSFSQVLQSIGYGALNDELTDALAECMEAVSEPGKTAELTLKLKFKSKAKGGQLIVSDDVITKLPKKQREDHIMFQTADLHLTAKDPRQGEFEGMRTVHTTKQDGGVKSVDVSLPTGELKKAADDVQPLRQAV